MTTYRLNIRLPECWRPIHIITSSTQSDQTTAGLHDNCHVHHLGHMTGHVQSMVTAKPQHFSMWQHWDQTSFHWSRLLQEFSVAATLKSAASLHQGIALSVLTHILEQCTRTSAGTVGCVLGQLPVSNITTFVPRYAPRVANNWYQK